MNPGVRRAAAFSLALLILVGLAALTWSSSTKQVAASESVDETHETIAIIDELDATLLAAESAKRAFLLTADQSQLDRYDAQVTQLSTLRLALQARVHEHPEIEAKIVQLSVMIDHRLEHHTRAIADRQREESGVTHDARFIRAGTAQSDEIRDLIAGLLSVERARLASRHAAARDEILIVRSIEITGIVVGVTILMLVFAGLRRETRMRAASEAEARTSEDKLATMLRSLAEGVIATDVYGRVTRMNRVAEQMTGWPERDALGRPFHDIARILDENTRERIDTVIARVLQTSLGFIGTEHRVLVSRGGVETVISKSAAPICDSSGRALGVVVVLRDASTERAWADQLRSLNAALEQRVDERTAALQASQEQLVQAQKMEAVGRLAGGIAHDFNNLLSVIVSYSDLIVDDLPGNSSLKDDIQEISNAAHRAAGLTKQLLAFSRRTVLAPKIVDLASVVTNFQSMLARVIGEDIELTVATAGELGKVNVDAGQIEQVLMNLAVNARDAMPLGGTLSISLANAELTEGERGVRSAGRYVALAITDTGTGMDEATRARIFEPFFTTKPTGQGTGLGLATVFGIVQQSGGVITVATALGAGTTFTIYLPHVAGSVAPRVLRRASKKRVGFETILVVEDNEQLRRIACSVLSDAGYCVLDAANGVEALALSAATKHTIHAVVTDVVMPKMGGRELSERLAAERPDTRFLFMSGYTDDTIVRHGVSENEIAFIHKPISPAVLLDKVADLLEGQRSVGRLSASTFRASGLAS